MAEASERYADLVEGLERARGEAAAGEGRWASLLADTVRSLAAPGGWDWTGIYLLHGEDLYLGPFVGLPTEHVRIPLGTGICGAAAAERETIVVDDVQADPRYLACFASTRSEIVVPILDGSRVIGELDVDSDAAARFGPEDRAGLEAVAARLAALAPAGDVRVPMRRLVDEPRDLAALGEGIVGRLEAKSAQRERVLERSRRVVRLAARSIHALHRRDWDEAERLATEGAGVLAEMQAATQGHPDLATAGYALDAEKELAEARLTRALLRAVLGLEDGAAPPGAGGLPGPEALAVHDAAWLNGLGEAAGELRRAALDAIRRGEIELAERILERMQEIYLFLGTIDLPGRVTRDLKRTNDMVRGVTERTRGDLTVAMRQEQLEAALNRLEARLGGGDG